ncbi:MAG: hypothetical protein KGL39_52695 [Patescibacteria group bacterium]|nr:hypothetical protein [Patescibacteria group bacterium]
MPARFVTLMNPSRRRRRTTLARRNRLGRFTRRTSVRRRRRVHYSVAHRRIRRRRVHRNPSHPPRMTPAMRRKVSAGVRRYYASRHRSHSTAVVRHVRHSVRRSYRSFGGGSLVGSFKSALGKPMLVKAGGAVLASFGTGYIMNRWGASLPLASNKWGKLVYTFGLPVIGAYLIRRKSPNLAEGLVIGGLVMSINSLMQSFNIGAIAGSSTPTTTATVSRYAVAGELGPRMFAAYPQAMAHPAAALGGSNVAFPTSAW